MLKGIVFDMDGVLFDTERLITEAWYEVGEQWKIERQKMEKAVFGCIGFNRTDTRNYFLKNFGTEFDYELFRVTSSELFAKKIEEEGLPVKVGVYELLEYLGKSGLKVGLASSTSTPSVRKHLEEAGITSYFEVIIGGEQVEHSKPQPDIYWKACLGLGLEPGDCMAIEDSPNGIRSAFGAGMKAVMVPDLVRADAAVEAMLYRKFDSLLEVKEFLEKKS